MNDTDLGKVVSGHVKWFDPTRGFGFVVATDGGPDILLHANVLRNFGQSSVADTAEIKLVVQRTERGVQAVEVLEIAPPEQPAGQILEDLELVDDEALNLPLEPARVKWFDKSKGFGFANIFGRPEDVFVHVEVLRRSGLADLMPGEAVGLRVIDGRRGRMAAHVLAWDAAVQDGKTGDTGNTDDDNNGNDNDRDADRDADSVVSSVDG